MLNTCVFFFPKRAILFLDSVKAFDNPVWTFIVVVLKKMGFSLNFLGVFIKNKNQNTSKWSFITTKYYVKRDKTRLSSTLSFLVLELLASQIDQEKKTSGIILMMQENKLKLFADNMLIKITYYKGCLLTYTKI